MIPVYKPSISSLEKTFVNDCLDSSWISSKGKYVELFEENFAHYIGIKHGVSVCNGTVALHLALVALGIEPGDEVIVPTFTYVAPVNAITYCGAKPVFVDALEATWQVDPDDIVRKITDKTRAILVVHLYGQACDMARIKDIAKRHQLLLIEDCAEAFGTYYDDRHVGTFGDVATFSFFGNKTITAGEGGIVVTNCSRLNKKLIHLRGQGLAEHRQYWHDAIGYNYRMTNIACSIAYAQLLRADVLLSQKRMIANHYKDFFEGSHIKTHNEQHGTVHSYWMNSVLFDCTEADRDRYRNILSEKGIETRPLFYPVHTMPIYSKRYERHPVAEDIAKRGFNIPSFPTLSDTELEYICNNIMELK